MNSPQIITTTLLGVALWIVPSAPSIHAQDAPPPAPTGYATLMDLKTAYSKQQESLDRKKITDM